MRFPKMLWKASVRAGIVHLGVVQKNEKKVSKLM